MEGLPARALWWGIGVAVVALVIDFFAPNVAVVFQEQNAQVAMDVVLVAMGLIQKLAMPLGAALIAASLVMRYVDWRFRATNADSRPAPIRLPATRDQEHR